MRIKIGSKWKCIDEDLEEYGLTGEVLEATDDCGFNGDGEVRIKHEDGSIIDMKVRKFHFRYKEV